MTGLNLHFKKRLNQARALLMTFAPLWWCLVGFMGVAFLNFKVIKTSNLAQSFRIENIPFLNALDCYYGMGFRAFVVLVGLGVVVSAALFFEKRAHPLWRKVAGGFTLIAGVGFLVAAISSTDGSSRPELQAVSWLDGANLVAYFVGTFAWLVMKNDETPPLLSEVRNRFVPRLSIIYILLTAALFSLACMEHRAFWMDPLVTKVAIAPSLVSIFGEAHLWEASFLLLSTSLLFVTSATCAALVGCWLFQHWVSRPCEQTGLLRRQVFCAAGLIGLAWTVTLVLPWLTKLWPEIRKEGVWIFPLSSLVVPFAAMLVLLSESLFQLRNDFSIQSSTVDSPREPVWRPGHLAFAACTLAPLYPFVRLFLPKHQRLRLFVLTVTGFAGAILGAFVMARVADWYTFDDWRGMFKRAQFPAMGVAFTMTAVWGLHALVTQLLSWYTSSRTIPAGHGAEPSSRRPGPFFYILRGVAVVLFLTATVPFLGHGRISKNTHARAVEFSDRYAFELQFMHSLLDFDRDGYSPFLHGDDPDDFDARMQAFGLVPLKPVVLAEADIEIVDAAKARAMPNIVLLYLEGVTTDAIHVYGRRRLQQADLALPLDGARKDLVAVNARLRSPTPFLDDIALRGTAFSNCRTTYPSTWDGWLQTQSGRHMMIAEFCADLFEQDYYARYNVLDKLCRKVGFNRFCYANCRPYTKALVSQVGRKENWEPDLAADPTEDQEAGELRLGDNQVARMVRFIESLGPKDRFFISEHMEESHFPWEPTSNERVRAISKEVDYDYNGTFDWVERDGLSESHRGYLSEVTRVDGQIGAVTNALKRKGVWDNTIVVVMGDHGCQWYEHRHLYYVSHLYEEAINPPFFLKIPGAGPRGILGHQVQQVDLVPTLLELSGTRIANPDVFSMDGRSLLPLIENRATPEEVVAIDKRSMILKTHYDKLGYLHEGRYKLIADRPYGTVRLFDLLNDPGEQHNLADQKPELLSKMRRGLAALAKEKGALLGGVLPPHHQAPGTVQKQ